MNPYALRPKRDWLVVLADPRKVELGSGIVVPLSVSERLSQGTGSVVAVGPGEKNEALGLVQGMKVAYRFHMSYAHPLPVDERWPDGSKRQYFFVATDDIMMEVVDPQTEVGFLSEAKG